MTTVDSTTVFAESAAEDPRRVRGLEIAATRKITRQSAHAWLVPSTTAVHPKKYRVDTREETCTCPDYEERTARCKHLFAVEFTERRRDDGNGKVEVTRTVRVTYGQKWTEYNAAQVYRVGHGNRWKTRKDIALIRPSFFMFSGKGG